MALRECLRACEGEMGSGLIREGLSLAKQPVVGFDF